LERACAVADAREISGTDWYEVGAEYLLAMEAEEGDWKSLYGAPLGTSFALLFLRRATARRFVISGPTSTKKVKDLGPEAPWLVELASDHRRNLTASIAPRVKVTSEIAGSPAHALTDGDLRTAWEAKKDDDEPRVTLDFGRRVKADTIAVGHPYAPHETPGARGRALLVSISIDGGPPRLGPMRPESERRARIELPEPVDLRRIDLRFPKVIPSGNGERGLALGEVQVLLRAR
ncbi:MAG: discoidin domain-containing protein, partial [Planctomycetota bacterium]|nr:discoidin domain-containing protein [Planctomycetota bacterium]